MCSICLHDPCLPGCPNYEPKHSAAICQICGDYIAENEEYLENHKGDIVHFDCIYSKRQLLKWLRIPVRTMEVAVHE